MGKLMRRLTTGKARRQPRLGMSPECDPKAIANAGKGNNKVPTECRDFPVKFGIDAIVADKEQRYNTKYTKDQRTAIDRAVDQVIQRYRIRHFVDNREQLYLPDYTGDELRAKAIHTVVDEIMPGEDEVDELDKMIDRMERDAQDEEEGYKEGGKAFTEGKCNPKTYTSTFFNTNNVPESCAGVSRDFAFHAFLDDRQADVNAEREKQEEEPVFFDRHEAADLLKLVDTVADRYQLGKFTPQELQLKLNTYSPDRLTALAAARVIKATPGEDNAISNMVDKAIEESKKAKKAPQSAKPEKKESPKKAEKREEPKASAPCDTAALVEGSKFSRITVPAGCEDKPLSFYVDLFLAESERTDPLEDKLTPEQRKRVQAASERMYQRLKAGRYTPDEMESEVFKLSKDELKIEAARYFNTMGLTIGDLGVSRMERYVEQDEAAAEKQSGGKKPAAAAEKIAEVAEEAAQSGASKSEQAAAVLDVIEKTGANAEEIAAAAKALETGKAPVVSRKEIEQEEKELARKLAQEAEAEERAEKAGGCRGFADHFRKTGNLPKSCRSVLNLIDVTNGFAPSWATDAHRGDVMVAIKKETERLLEGKAAGMSPRQKNPYRAKAAVAVWDDCELARKEAGIGVSAPEAKPIVEDKPAKVAKPKKERAKKAEKAPAAPPPEPSLPAITPKAVETLPVKKTELVVGPGRNRQGAEIVGRFTVNDRAYACHLKRVRVNQYTTEKRPKVFCFADMTATPKKKAAATAA